MLNIRLCRNWTLFHSSREDGVAMVQLLCLHVQWSYETDASDEDEETYTLDVDATPTATRDTRDDARIAVYRDVLLATGLDESRASVGATMAAQSREMGAVMMSTQIRPFCAYLRKMTDAHVSAFLSRYSNLETT